MDSILKRRSIRKYKAISIPDEMIQSILEAGMNAPSAGNEQPWHFIVVKDKEMLKKVAGLSPYAGMLASAGAAIIIMGDLSLEIYKGFWVQDCSAAAQNMLLKITEMGLGSVWTGVYPMQDRVDYLKKIFLLPENIVPFAVLPVGYPDEDPKPVSRFNQARIHKEKW